MRTLLDYADRSAPISATTTGGDVYARFENEAETFALCVVDADNRPIGLIDRNDFLHRMGAEFGRALFANRPVTFVMRPARIQNADVDVMDFLAQVISVNRAALLDGFVVVDDDGRYLAVGTALSLISAGYSASKARVRELAAKSARLSRAERKAQAASRAKSQFLAVMSHEIRTPLNGVLAVAEIIDRKLQQDELRPYIDTIMESGRTLHRLLTDALDLSRAEAGAMDLAPEATDLDSLLRGLEVLWRPLAQHRNLDLSVTLRGAQGVCAAVDQVRLKQVLNNLVGNALKFTETGRVAARFELAQSPAGVRLAAEVEDSGVGISDEQLERIFEPFAKADEHNGGAGLGLAICRQLVEAMGGELTAVSRLGEGSVFRFAITFPEVEAPAPQPAETAVEVDGAVRILVVDDNAANRLVACTMLEMAGLSTVTANDGVAAVEEAQRQPFAAILMDVKMPRLNGVDAARAIRAREGPNRATPILALTANADPTDASLYRAAGMDDVVSKPITAQRLLAAIAGCLNGQDSTIAANAA